MQQAILDRNSQRVAKLLKDGPLHAEQLLTILRDAAHFGSATTMEILKQFALPMRANIEDILDGTMLEHDLLHCAIASGNIEVVRYMSRLKVFLTNDEYSCIFDSILRRGPGLHNRMDHQNYVEVIRYLFKDQRMTANKNMILCYLPMCPIDIFKAVVSHINLTPHELDQMFTNGCYYDGNIEVLECLHKKHRVVIRNEHLHKAHNNPCVLDYLKTKLS